MKRLREGTSTSRLPTTTVEAINDVLAQYGLETIQESDLKPIVTA